MIDRRGFLTFLLAGSCAGLVGGPALAQSAADATPAAAGHPRRRWRGSAPDIQREANAVEARGPIAPNGRRGRGGNANQTAKKPSDRQVVAQLDKTPRASRVRGAVRRAPDL